MNLNSISKADLTALLEEAKEAHSAYESLLGSKDDDWAQWYADFILKKMRTRAESGDVPAAEDVLQQPAKTTGKPATAPVSSKTSKTTERDVAVAFQVCPTCAYRNRAGVLFCENCGTNLTTGEQSAAGTRDLRNGESAENPKAQTAKLDDDGLKDEAVSKAVRSAGSTVFEPGMNLRVEIEGGSKPIVVTPRNDDLILGRRDPTTGATPEVDMTPYAGYRMGVSRRHASLRLKDNQLNLWDLGSSNGTFLNGNRLTPHRPYPVRDGDEVRLGQMILRIFFRTDADGGQ